MRFCTHLDPPTRWGDVLRVRTMRKKLPVEGTTAVPRLPPQFIFGYESPTERESNRALGTDYESTGVVRILAADEPQAKAWDRGARRSQNASCRYSIKTRRTVGGGWGLRRA